MHPHFVVDEPLMRVDEPAPVRLVGVRPGARVTIVATARDAVDEPFVSRSTFAAGDDGVVDVCRDAPVSAGYEGVDPFGIWWSMTSPSREGFSAGLSPMAVDLTASIDDVTVARAHVQRLVVSPGVRIERVDGDTVVGVLFVPPHCPAPAAVVLGGSGGGVHWSAFVAALLASHGFTALALAYFGAPARPARLIRIPVECVGSALRWLLHRDEVRGDRAALMGRSRGAELALLAAALHPEAGAVVGFSASGVRWGGYDPASSGAEPAWTWRGDELPYLVPDAATVDAALADSQVALRPAFAEAMRDAAAVARATIPTEHIRGAVLLVSGADDQMWPAEEMASIALRRRRGLRQADADAHLVFARAGHAVGQPPGLPLHEVAGRHPIDGETYLLGGTIAGNAASGAAAWPRMLEFLRRHG